MNNPGKERGDPKVEPHCLDGMRFAVLPLQQPLARFGDRGCLTMHSTMDFLLTNGMKGLKSYNGTSRIHQSSS